MHQLIRNVLELLTMIIYIQANYDADIYLHLSAGFYSKTKDKYILKILKDLDDLYQGGYNFYKKLKLELTLIKGEFAQSKADPYLFCQKGLLYYVIWMIA